MKRQHFHIKSSVGHDTTKTTWNASIRAIEQAAKALAVENGADYVLTNSKSVKEGFYHVSGTREWTNSKNGCVVVFSVQKLEG